MKFRKKPVVIDAMQWRPEQGIDHSAEICRFLGRDFRGFTHSMDRLLVGTYEGELFALPGDWIIRGVEGEHYPCKPDIFEKTYEAVV